MAILFWSSISNVLQRQLNDISEKAIKWNTINILALWWLETMLTISPDGSPMCSTGNLEMFYPMNFFGYVYSFGVLELIQFCCPSGNIGHFFNLLKSKMNSGRHLDYFTFEPLVLECVIPLFWGSKVHLWCYFFLQIIVKFKVKCDISVDNQLKVLLNVIFMCMFELIIIHSLFSYITERTIININDICSNVDNWHTSNIA